MTLLRALRSDLLRAGFTEHALHSLVSEHAHRGCRDGNFLLAQYELRGNNSPLAGLFRLFTMGERLTEEELDRTLPTLRTAGGLDLGLLTEHAEDSAQSTYLAAWSLTALHFHGHDLFILSDLDGHLRRGELGADHVMGIGGATRTLLAQINPGEIAGQQILDLGTGCGTLALACAAVGAEVTATDISSRAGNFARINQHLNDLSFTFVLGDGFQPVNGREFDTIIANPPFVIEPDDEHEPLHQYRSSGQPGDAFMQQTLKQLPDHLRVGGTALLLGNWEVLKTEDTEAPVEHLFERPLGWIRQGTTAWIVARLRLSPEQYALMWAHDANGPLAQRQSADYLVKSLREFERRNVEEIVFGWFRLQREPAENESVRFTEQVPEPAPAIPVRNTFGAAPDDTGGQDFAAQMSDTFATGRFLSRCSDTEVLESALIRVPSATETRQYVPGSEDPSHIWITVQSPVPRSFAVDTVCAAVVGACDGELSLWDLCGGISQLYEVDQAEVAAQLLPVVRELAWHGVFQRTHGQQVPTKLERS
jgi:hypothetical protein